MTPAEILFLLLAGHCLCDYPLQGDFMARAKNPKDPIGKDLWWMVLPSHGLIHGAAVYLITGSLGLGLMEWAAHNLIDWAKCEGKISYAADQALHVLCKTIWLALLLWVIS